MLLVRVAMRLAWLLSLSLAACGPAGGAIDLGSVADGKSDAPQIDHVDVTIPAGGSATFTVASTVDFVAALAYDGDAQTDIRVTNTDTTAVATSALTARPTVTVSAADTPASHAYEIVLDNPSDADVQAQLSVTGVPAVSPALLAAARANLDRVDREIDFEHLKNYGLPGTNTDQFMTALAAEFATQHPDSTRRACRRSRRWRSSRCPTCSRRPTAAPRRSTASTRRSSTRSRRSRTRCSASSSRTTAA